MNGAFDNIPEDLETSARLLYNKAYVLEQRPNVIIAYQPWLDKTIKVVPKSITYQRGDEIVVEPLQNPNDFDTVPYKVVSNTTLENEIRQYTEKALKHFDAPKRDMFSRHWRMEAQYKLHYQAVPPNKIVNTAPELIQGMVKSLAKKAYVMSVDCHHIIVHAYSVVFGTIEVFLDKNSCRRGDVIEVSPTDTAIYKMVRNLTLKKEIENYASKCFPKPDDLQRFRLWQDAQKGK